MGERLEHAFRMSLIGRERRFRLGDDALEIDDGVGTQAIPFAGIAGIRLYKQSGASFGPTIRRTVLTLSDGGTVVLQSSHYVSLGTFEDRVESYRALAGALVARVTAANPQARVTVGHSWFAWSVWFALLVGALAVLALGAVLLVRRDFPVAALLYLGVVVAFVPLMWRVVSRSRPRLRDPRALPAGILD